MPSPQGREYRLYNIWHSKVQVDCKLIDYRKDDGILTYTKLIIKETYILPEDRGKELFLENHLTKLLYFRSEVSVCWWVSSVRAGQFHQSLLPHSWLSLARISWICQGTGRKIKLKKDGKRLVAKRNFRNFALVHKIVDYNFTNVHYKRTSQTNILSR